MVTVNNTTVDFKAQLEKNGSLAFVPSGNSMWPIIKNRGQSVIITKKKERLKKYDVAFYIRDNGAYVLHRVIDVTDSGYVTCGDAQFMREQVGEDQVFGVLAGFYVGKEYIDATNQK